MVIKFYGRERELDFIEEAYEKRSIKSIMMVLYGRRRVGKTTLIKKLQLVTKVLRVVVKGREEPYIIITMFYDKRLRNRK